jgi:hypothetical protein
LNLMESFTSFPFIPMTRRGESSSMRGRECRQANCPSMKLADDPESIRASCGAVIPSMSRVRRRDLLENNEAQYRGSWDNEGIGGVLDTGQVSLRLFPTPQESPRRLGRPFCLFQVESSPQAVVSTQSDNLQTCGCSLHT